MTHVLAAAKRASAAGQEAAAVQVMETGAMRWTLGGG